MKKLVFLVGLLGICTNAYATLAGGRPNAFSEGNNAFAGVVNPANNVWLKDRFDVGAYWVYQKASINNHDNKPSYPPGKTDLTYRSRNILTADVAIHKQLNIGCSESSVTIAAYTMPSIVRIRTKEAIPASGTTPVRIQNKTNVFSTVLSFKVSPTFSLGVSFEYLYFTHRRDGFQNADNPLRSVSPGHVTNRGNDHSGGFGVTIGLRWNITEKLFFGTAWSKKNSCGRYWKYRGFEPHHAKNYSPETVGAGFSYRFTNKIAGKLECLWIDQGNLPGANNSILPNGKVNTNKRGSNKSPGPGLQDATFINVGLGYKVNEIVALGAGLSHRLKFPKSSNYLSHTYRAQTIYNSLHFGAHFQYNKHEVFAVLGFGLKNRVSGFVPQVLGGGKFTGEKQTTSFSLSYGYKY